MSDQCAWCDEPKHVKQGRISLCAMHYRISSMRACARRNGKLVPTRQEIEWFALNMSCFGCGKEMHWLAVDGRKDQATLQHDRDGTIRLLCLSCNVRHSHNPDDSFYELPKNHKHCPDCEKVLPYSSFCKDKSRPVGLKSYCRGCAKNRHKQWRESYG